MPNDAPADETRMRAALGLLGHAQPKPTEGRPAQNLQRRRFVRDGEVAVTVINPVRSNDATAESPYNQLAGLRSTLVAEQAAHAQTKRALEQALATIQTLEAKYAHGELDHAEAMRQEQDVRAQAEAALQQLQTQLQNAEVRAQQRAKAAKPSEASSATRQSGRIVQWWLPGYGVGKKQRR